MEENLNNLQKKKLLDAVRNFFKGTVIGLGAVAPGLSGSILLVIFGLYEKIISAISTLFKKFRKNILFLLPLGLGILLGIFLFSNLVDFLLGNWPMQTRFAFMGLILGTVPLFYREVTKQGFRKKYYFYILGAFLLGTLLFQLNGDLFPEITQPDLPQSILMGFVVATSYIVPGIDSAAVLMTLGLHRLWTHSLATLDLPILLPACIGAVAGVLSISYIINKLLSKWYTATFSIIFGLFLSVIPSVFDSSCQVELDWKSAVSLLLLLAGFAASLLFGQLDRRRDTKKE